MLPMRPIEADYRDGVLQPTKPLRLQQGERVALVVLRRPDPSRWDLERLARIGSADDARLAEQGLEAWSAALDAEDSH